MSEPSSWRIFRACDSGLEGAHLAVEAVAARGEGELVEVDRVDGIDRVGPAQAIVEGDAQEVLAHEGRPGGIDAGSVEVGLEPGEEVAPGEVGVGQQQGVAAGRVGGRYGPGVRTGLVVLEALAHGLGLRRADHEREVEDPLGVGEHVRGSHREHDAALGIEPFAMRLGVVVHALCEGLQVPPPFGSLLAEPGQGARGHAHAQDPLVRVHVLLAPVLGGPAPGLAVEAQDQVALRLHLGPAVGVEERLVIGGEDVGHAVGVPEDLRLRAFRGRGGGGPAAAGLGRGARRGEAGPGERGRQERPRAGRRDASSQLLSGPRGLVRERPNIVLAGAEVTYDEAAL